MLFQCFKLFASKEKGNAQKLNIQEWVWDNQLNSRVIDHNVKVYVVLHWHFEIKNEFKK